jgi:hypothetical protein
METVFITSGLLVAALFFTANYLVKGIGGMSAPLQQIGMFLLNKAPAGIIDLFSDEVGSGSKTWIRFGLVWFILATISAFLGLWHSYDGSALDSLASIGWSYDDGSMLTDYTNVFFMTALNYMLVGGALVAVSRTAKGRLASEKSASMVALLLTASTAAYLILPVLLSFVSLDNEAGIIDNVTNMSALVVGSLLHAAILINVLITIANRSSDNISPTTWFLVLALVAKILGGLMAFIGELAGSTQTVWMAEHVLTGWVPLALIFGLAYHIIPFTTGTPVWSESMFKVSLLLLFVTVPPFYMTAASSAELLQNVGAILLTLGLLPIFAGCFNLLITAKSNAAAILKSPGAFAATGAMLLLPLYAVGGYFTSMDVFVGLGNLGTMAETVDQGFMYTVGGLMMLASVFTAYPLAARKQLANPSNAQLAVWFTIVGGLSSTIIRLMGDFTDQAVANSGVEDAVASSGGFLLVASAMFYLCAIAAIMTTQVLIRTGTRGNADANETIAVSDISTYTLAEGTTTIRTLLGRGVGVDTQLNIGHSEEETGATIIAVGAHLHNEEVTEFPEDPSAPAEELVMLADYLSNSDQTIFKFFQSIDLDDSGTIDGFEFQKALKNAKIANLPPWEMGALIEAMDLDGDGKINLPELDIALSQIRTMQGSSEEE